MSNLTPQSTTFHLSAYTKAIVMFIVGLVGFIGQLLTDGSFDFNDGIALAVWLGGTLGVYSAKNTPTKP